MLVVEERDLKSHKQAFIPLVIAMDCKYFSSGWIKKQNKVDDATQVDIVLHVMLVFFLSLMMHFHVVTPFTVFFCVWKAQYKEKVAEFPVKRT